MVSCYLLHNMARAGYRHLVGNIANYVHMLIRRINLHRAERLDSEELHFLMKFELSEGKS